MSIIGYPFGAGKTLTRVLESGQGDKHVVLIHGLGARADRWTANLEVLAAAGYHCYALDLPGHGYADKRADFAYGVPAFAGFVKDFLDSAKIERAVVVGTSLGGHVAGYFASRNPTRTQALALVGSVGLAPLGRQASENVRTNVKNTTRDGIIGKLKFVLARHHLITDALIDEEFRINNSPGAQRAFDILGDYIVESIDHDAIGDQIKTLASSKPIILIWGADDRAVPLKVGESARDRAGVELVVMPGCGHCPYMEDPARFNEIFLGFLKKAGL
ncbi:MAG: alpha/beta fold hydrolase [Alphaproteobacteria bacterium]|nr:alpha/beta fold hydrolase [Alphaproteobacteria bacterium]